MSYQFDTLTLHAGQVPDSQYGARAQPIYLTTSFVFRDADQAAALFNMERGGHVYSRISNPTNAVLEERLAALEGGIGGVAAASGQAALHLAITTLMGAGGHIVASRSLYGGSHNLLDYTLPRFGITTTFVDPRDLAAWRAAIRPETRLLFGETLGNLPGHGRSTGEPLLSVEHLADWAIALLDAAGVGQATLVGHSMGSLVALEAAVRFPQRVGRAVLIGSSLPMSVAPVLLDASHDDEPKAVALINAWSYSPSGQIGGSAVPGLWLLGMNRRLMERQKPGVFFRDMSACNAYARSPESLAAIAAPVLIVAGSLDRMTPPKAAGDLREFIPGARLVTFKGSGHALMAEKPDAVLDVLRDFIAS